MTPIPALARVHRSPAVLAFAAALFVGVFALRLSVTGTGFGFTLLYDVPVALVAVTFGFRAGLAAATVGLVLYAIGDVSEPIRVHGAAIQTNAVGYASRALVLYLLGGLLGLYSDRSRRAEATVRQSEAHFRQALKDSPISVWNQDRELHYIWAHKAIPGLSQDEILGTTDAEAFGMATAARLGEVKREVLRTGQGRRVELEIPNGGKPVHLDVIVNPVRDSAGEVTGITGTTTDITELRRTEQELRDAGHRFQALAQSVNDAIVGADEDGTIRFWNDRARELFGYEREEAIGQELTLLMPARYQEAHRTGFARTLRTGESQVIGHTVELDGRRKDGSEFPLELSLGESRHAGKRSFTGVIRDTTERQRSGRYLAAQYAVAHVLVESPSVELAAERLLAGIAQSMGWQVGALWTLDSGDALRCQATWHESDVDVAQFDAMTRALTFKRGTGLPGRVWARGEPVWIRDATLEPNFPRAPAARQNGLRGAIGVPLITAGGFIGALEFFSPEIKEPDRELIEMMSTIGAQVGQFIQRKRAEAALTATAAELRARATELERSNAELEQFASVASHDLSEPLRTVSGFVKLLSKRYGGRLDDDADEFIGYAVDGVDRMQGLIDDLLAFSLVGHGDRELTQVNTHAVAERVLEALSPQIAESGGTVEIGELPAVPGDEHEIAQLLQNLISNALKFRGTDPPIVRVSAEPEEASTGPTRWRFSVADNGIGIEARHAERIFKMFQRLHTREEYAGTGIGLAICKKIVEHLDGEISVHPRAGGGSVFEFTVPDRQGIAA
jgi:PAS domain S-box-containing protein